MFGWHPTLSRRKPVRIFTASLSPGFASLLRLPFRCRPISVFADWVVQGGSPGALPSRASPITGTQLDRHSTPEFGVPGLAKRSGLAPRTGVSIQGGPSPLAQSEEKVPSIFWRRPPEHQEISGGCAPQKWRCGT